MLEISFVALPHFFTYTSFLLVKSRVIYLKQILFLWIFFPAVFLLLCKILSLLLTSYFFLGPIKKFSPLLPERLKSQLMSPSMVPHPYPELYPEGVYLLSSLNENKIHHDFEFYSRKYQWLCLLSSFSFLLLSFHLLIWHSSLWEAWSQYLSLCGLPFHNDILVKLLYLSSWCYCSRCFWAKEQTLTFWFTCSQSCYPCSRVLRKPATVHLLWRGQQWPGLKTETGILWDFQGAGMSYRTLHWLWSFHKTQCQHSVRGLFFTRRRLTCGVTWWVYWNISCRGYTSEGNLSHAMERHPSASLVPGRLCNLAEHAAR